MKKVRPRITEEEYSLILGIREQCDLHQVGIENIEGGWLKNKESSLRFKNPLFRTQEEKAKEIDFSTILEGIRPLDYTVESIKSEALFDRLVYTDVHIGMEVNPNGLSLYGGKWDREELLKRVDIMAESIIENKKSNKLYIDELGDLMDGWDGMTTRKGHKLPQNMTNQEAYDTAIEFKLRLLLKIAPHYEEIVCNNICEDNHSGAFGYVVNSAFKKIAEQMFHNVTVNNMEKFISHYVAEGGYVFILTHGKDSKNLRFGFKPVLDKASENKIDNYIKEFHLWDKGVNIEFSKGDSHQYIFDNSTSQTFNYYSYPAFSPSSDWVQTNFQKGISGFVHFNYFPDRKAINDKLFEW